MQREEFEVIVRDTLEHLPSQFQYVLENVAIVIEDEPATDDGTDELLGVYDGVPLTERGAGDFGLPDRIRIFRGPLLRACDTREELAEEIRRTVIHELGHHMGLDDHEMPY